jgi:hypothetical protein
MAARQFWYGQRIWTQHAPTQEPNEIPTREIEDHPMASMSIHTGHTGNATQLGYKEVNIGSTRPFKARVPIFDLPFGDLSTFHASALAQLFQLHMADHVLERGCPWCPYRKEDLPRGVPDHRRLAALWHLLAAHPREYMETLQHLYQAAPMPARPADAVDWRNPPQAFTDYMVGVPLRASASRPARSGRPREIHAPDTHPDSGRPSRLPTLVEQGTTEAPEVDL